MPKQNYEVKNDIIREAFLNLKRTQPDRLNRRLNLSWSNWGFGMESLADSAARLARSGIQFIELHGNHYGPDLGYRVDDTRRILADHGIRVGGICGMFSPDNDLSSNRAFHRQAAVDYLRRELEFASAVEADYILVVPGAVGRPKAYDDMEFERSLETQLLVTDAFTQYNIPAAIEPIRSAEVSFCHTIADAKQFIAAMDHPMIAGINGDVYHMQAEEAHIGAALIDAGDQLINLHLADSQRGALGTGAMDLDTIIRALYVIGFNVEGKYVTPEPLGPGGDPYPAMYGRPDTATLDALVEQSARYFREREESVLAETAD